MAVERARPLLGTTVSIRVHGLSRALADCAIDDAFAAIGHIHACMSFHEEASDVSVLNREAHTRAVDVDPDTFAVLRLARDFAEVSDGAFDVTVAPHLVDWEFLPLPDAPRPDPYASWRDIELLPEWRVRFHRPLWIDLGGIAKGYAVDRALERLRAHGAVQASVNAGGDLRVFGPASERVLLTPQSYRDGVPVIEIENGSIASSGGYGRSVSPHFDGRTARRADADMFVSVVASECAVADAMTKVVLALARDATPILARHDAAAHLYSPRLGWQHFGNA